jgi:stage V sporulation protein SpoVS
MAVVADLGARGASGVLEVKGNPSGAIYLDRGRIAFARASWVPGLVARLRGILPSPAELQDLLAGRDADDAAVAALAVKRGYLTPAGLHELIGSIVVDAFLVLTIPLALDSTVASIRFASARTYWTEMFPRLDIDPVRGEALRRAQRMADYGLAPTTAVALRDLRRPTAVLTREQWAVASLISGNASARGIALRHGRPLADTVECLGSLIRVGLCTPIRVTARRQLPPRPSGQVPSLVPPGPPAQRQHVRRVAPDHPALPERYGPPSQAPTVDILRQVLNGLRKLS